MKIINRNGVMTTLPDMSSEAVNKAADASGLSALMESGSRDPAAMMEALMGMQQHLGVTQKALTPEEAAHEFFGDTDHEPDPDTPEP